MSEHRPDSFRSSAKKLLAAPTFEDDDKTRTAWLLNTTLLVFALTGILIGPVSALLDPVYALFSLVAAGMLSAACVIMLVFLRRGHVRRVSQAFLLFLLLLVTGVLVAFGGIRSTLVILYFFGILLGGMLLGKRGAIVTGAASTLCMASLYLMDLQGGIMFLPPPQVRLFDLAMLVILTLSMILLACFMVGSVTEALGHSQRHARGLQATQALLEERIISEQAQYAQMQALMRSEQDQRELLRRTMAQVYEAANNLTAASSEILAATTQQASGASEQAAAIAQTSTTIDEVRAIADQTAQRASGVADIAQRTTEVARLGEQAVADTVSGMGNVKRKVDTIAHNILALSEQAQAIGQIVEAVNDLATQSHMLALNASVEAARAGEAGKGFAVVASEVRALAEQSRAATVQVSEILSEIQKGVNTSVMATEEGIKGADAGLKLVGQAGEAIRRLGESVAESAQSSLQIAAAAGQQVAGMEQISEAMRSILQVTTQGLSSTQQAERSTQELNELAGQLRETVGQYQS